MKLIAGGDSFIWGSELADSTSGEKDGYSHNTYPALLAQHAVMDYVCAAYPGNANDAISRMTLDSSIQHSEQFLLVTWTFPQRREFRFGDKWESINSWHTVKKEFSIEYFKHVGDNEYYEIYTTLKEILFLQNYCLTKQIPYLFLTANNTFYQHENYYRSVNQSINSLYDNIEWSNWFWFPSDSEANETQAPRGFYQWAVENKYSVGPHWHPLENAHIDAANLIKEKFNDLVKKYYQSR
jgi:hypothetical protein